MVSFLIEGYDVSLTFVYGSHDKGHYAKMSFHKNPSWVTWFCHVNQVKEFPFITSHPHIFMIRKKKGAPDYRQILTQKWKMSVSILSFIFYLLISHILWETFLHLSSAERQMKAICLHFYQIKVSTSNENE